VLVASRLAFCSVLLILAAPAADQQTLPTANENNSYTIEYTGRLFGYFRIPEVQKMNDLTCPNLDPAKDIEALAFLNASQKVEGKGTRLLVAVGDNFAPFLLSRKMLRGPDDAKGKGGDFRLKDKANYEFGVTDASNGVRTWAPFDDLTADGKQRYLDGHGTVPMDNVACFLTSLKFDAIVPGPHDFYFGPERLRVLARLLDQGPNPTRMLASDLYMRATYTDLQNPTGSGASDASSQTKVPSKAGKPEGAAKTVLPKVILPWMRGITVKNANAGEASKVTDVCAFAVDPLEKSVPKITAEQCKAAPLHFTPPNDNDKAGANRDFRLPASNEPIDPGTYRAYLMFGDGKVEPESQAFTVQLPFLEYPASSHDQQALFSVKPWVLKGSPGMQGVAVFGVVGSTLTDDIGKLNSMWLYSMDNKTDKNREVDVQLADTAEALKQVFQYCEDIAECKSARKVLLAQMPQQEAYDLIPHIALAAGANPIDVIVAEADPDRATRERELVRTLPQSAPPTKPLAPIVLVPGSHFAVDDPYKLDVHVNEATVIPSYFQGVGPKRIEKQFFSNTVHFADGPPTKVNPFPGELDFLTGSGPGSMTITGYADPRRTDTAAMGATNSYSKFYTDSDFEHQDWKPSLERLALYAMRESCHADIAMIQHRDVFLAEQLRSKPVSHEGLRQLMSTIFWKGDFVVCQNLSGDTINSVLKTSKQLEDDETNGLATELTKGWGVATLGADASASQDANRLIDSQLLDPKRLYSVALTDYLATGSTGYSMLSGAEPPPMTAWKKVKFISLSEVIATMLYRHRPPSPGDYDIGNSLLDITDLSHSLQPSTDKAIKRSFVYPAKPRQPGFLDWMKQIVTDSAKERIPCDPAPGCLESHAQQKPVWWVDLYKLDLSYGLFVHNGSEASIGQRFPGVTSVSLSTPESATKAIDYILRTERDSARYIGYVQSSMNYGYKVQRGTTGGNEAYQPSQTADYWYQELGAERRIGHPQPSPSGWKVVLAAGLQTQPSRPLTQFSASSYGLPSSSGGSSSASTAAPLAAPRSIYSLQHAGFRYDFGYPKPKSTTQGGGGGQGGGTSSASGGGGGGKKGSKGGGGSSQSGSSSQGQGQGSGQGSAGSQAQTFNSYLEFGFERGTTYHGVDYYNFQAPAGGQVSPVACQVVDTACLGKYGAGTLLSVTADRSHQQRGFYFNFRFDAPLPVLANSELVLENKGTWMPPHGDIMLDTRLNDDFKASLTVPIWQKISIAPTMELFFYQNQVFGQLYRSYSTSLALSYSFEWHNGLKWNRAGGYSNPVPTQPTLPVK
jgi:hypothetical protein